VNDRKLDVALKLSIVNSSQKMIRQTRYCHAADHVATLLYCVLPCNCEAWCQCG